MAAMEPVVRRFFYWLFVILGVAIVLLLFARQGSAQISPYKQIDFNWDYKPNLPICEKVNRSCFYGFRMSDLLSGNVVAPLLSPLVRSWVFIPEDGVWYGKHTFELVALGYDTNGAHDQSTAASAVINVVPPPRAPTMFKGALQK
jgi:hypothetical protein